MTLKKPDLPAVRSDHSDIGSLFAFRASHDIERNTLVFFQGFETVRLDRREMGENIFAPLIGSDETEAFCIVKPFYSTCCHYNFLFQLNPACALTIV